MEKETAAGGGSPENPWKKIDGAIVYKNPWITVREDKVIRPDGLPGIYGVVECRRAVGVIAIAETGEICLVGQHRYAMECYSWEIVEGGAEAGEDLLAAIQRELQEEAGLQADHWERLGGEVHISNCHSSERGYLFVATGLHAVPASPEGTEDITVRWVSLEEALKMVLFGEMQDSLSMIGVLLLARRFEEGALEP